MSQNLLKSGFIERTLLLSLLLGSLWLEVIVPVRVPSMGQAYLIKNYLYSIRYLMSYNSKLFLLRIFTWSYNCFIRIIIISYLKPYNCVQTNNYYFIDIITWNFVTISIRQEYYKPYNRVEIICIGEEYLMSYNFKILAKKKKKTTQKSK